MNTVFMTDAVSERTYEVIIVRYVSRTRSGVRPLPDFQRRLMEVRAQIARLQEEEREGMSERDHAELEVELRETRLVEAVLLWATRQDSKPESQFHPVFSWVERLAR
jgi:hypothetical protein